MQQLFICQQLETDFSSAEQQLLDSQQRSIECQNVEFKNPISNQLTTFSQKNSSDSYCSCDSDDQKQNQELKKVQFIIKPSQAQQNFQINIFTGLQITSDGVIRYFPSIQPVYFGFNQYESIQVEDFTESIGLINLKQYRRANQIKSSYKQALDFIQFIPTIQQQLVKETFTYCDTITCHLSEYFAKQISSEAIFKTKDEEFKMFQQSCMNFLTQLNKQNGNLMYCYQIFQSKLKNQ